MTVKGLPTRNRRTPLSRHRDNLRADYASLKDEGPLVVTSRGEDVAVILSVETYDRLLAEVEAAEVREGIQRGEAAVARGEVRDAREVMAELATRHGLDG